MPGSATRHDSHTQPDSSSSQVAGEGHVIQLQEKHSNFWHWPSLRETSKGQPELALPSSLCRAWGLCFCLEGARRPRSRGDADSRRPRGGNALWTPDFNMRCRVGPPVLGKELWSAGREDSSFCPRNAPWDPCQILCSNWSSRNIRRYLSLFIITGTWLSAELKLRWPSDRKCL